MGSLLLAAKSWRSSWLHWKARSTSASRAFPLPSSSSPPACTAPHLLWVGRSPPHRSDPRSLGNRPSVASSPPPSRSPPAPRIDPARSRGSARWVELGCRRARRAGCEQGGGGGRAQCWWRRPARRKEGGDLASPKARTPNRLLCFSKKQLPGKASWASWESAFGEATAPPNRALIFLASMQQRHSLCWSLALRNTTSKATWYIDYGCIPSLDAAKSVVMIYPQ